MLSADAPYFARFTTPATLLHDEQASEAGRHVLERAAVRVECDYTGGQKLELFLGRADAEPFAFLRDSQGRHAFLQDPSAELVFGLAFAFVEYHQSFVDPDPHSPEYFGPQLDLEDLQAEIRDKLDTEVQGLFDF